jgi:GH24 family phage-related lysozyme (muramidase)
VRDKAIIIAAAALAIWYVWQSTKAASTVDTASGEGQSDAFTSAADQALQIGYQVTDMGNRQISLAGLNRIKQREGFRSQPYKDSAGLWTAGYGHKFGALEQVQAMSEADAASVLASDVATVESTVNALVTVPLTQDQFDSLVSFVFNVGSGAFRRSTLLSKLNAGDYAGARDQFAAWSKITINGIKQTSSGLLARRNDEAQQFA